VIKKIRAVYHLISFADPLFDFEEHFSEFGEIFKAAGKIRDIDITSKCIRKVARKDSRKIISLLRKKRTLHSRKLRKTARQIRRTNTFTISNENITQQEIFAFLAKTLLDIRSASNKKMNAKHLHGIRKRCKEYLYIARAGGKEVYGHSKDNLRRINPLQNQIGVWHDYLIATEIIILKKEKFAGSILKTLKKKEKQLRRKAIKFL
jgi:CHAD domain-containing protein